ncbi:hypothetical protein M5689_020502 [Euphorbia peplus]|nr:hypothetical protein M5689_020502 [Euphorbia peplus]
MTSTGSKFENNFDHSNGTTLKLTCGSFYLPKDKRNRPQGQDAYFICNAKNTIAVADGVGGCSVDAGIYARELMENSFNALLDQNKGSVNPVSVLRWAHTNTKSEGSSTACIVALNDNHVLRYANMGDSGFILFRENKLNYRTPIQQHRFNCPYQLSYKKKDTSSMANQEEIRVEEGDFIVVGTDGLFDNVYAKEIEEILNRNKGDDLDKLALEISDRALVHSMDRTYNSPFAKAAKLEGREHTGGKNDDITVVVAKVELDLSAYS